MNIKKFLVTLITFLSIFSLNSCDSIKNQATNKNLAEVAVLMPLSGENEAVGKQYANLVKIGIANGAQIPIKVTLYDSANETALKESIKQILEQKIKIIIGPIYSAETKLLALQIKDHQDIAAISLSNDPTVADSNIFVFGHAPMKQVEQMTSYLIDSGYKNYITLLPSGRHSQTVSKIVQSMIANRGGTLNKIEFYENNEEGIARSVKTVSDIVDGLNEEEENLKQPVIIIGDESATLKKLYKIAKNFKLDKKAVIAGDNRLDSDSNEQISIIFTGSIKIDSSNLKQKALAFGVSDFSFIHALAYDAGKIVATYIGQQYNKDIFLNSLKNTENFEGVSGRISFVDSIAKRRYEIIKKQNGTYQIQNN